jgi:hypothetical protein
VHALLLLSGGQGPLARCARAARFDTCHVPPYIPRELRADQRDVIDEYVYEYVSFLLAEIIGADVVGSVYSRAMLAWFHAGRLPCGWCGACPRGRVRVY